jgi:hypothetical protein
MAGTGQRLQLRCFLEGVEVPIIAATVQTMPNAPAACTVQLPPLPEGTRLFPRTLVHVFFLDFYEVQSPLLSNATTAAGLVTSGKVSPTTYERSVLRGVDDNGGATGEFIDEAAVPEFRNQRYKLLFSGEVVGFAWTKSAANRCLALQCLDLSNYWDYAYQWNNTDLFGPGIKALFSGGGTSLFTDILEEEGSAILRIIQTPSTQYPNLKGLLGGIVHLLEAIGGSYYTSKKYAGQNIFFSLAELRLHITQMITAYEKDPTAHRLIGATSYDSLFGRRLGGLGQQVSIRQAINALMSMIFHETYAIPSPLYVPGTGGTVGGASRQSIKNIPDVSFIATEADSILRSIEQLKASLSVEADDDKLVSRSLQTLLVARMTDTIRMAKGAMNRIRGKEVQAARGYYGTGLALLTKAKALMSKWHANGEKRTNDAIAAALNEAKTPFQRASSMEIITRSKGAVPARLNQQIFRPDVWFSAPPRCNVLFPEHYTQLNYQRSFLQEPTRFLLKTNDEFFGEDELFDKFYFAPKAITLKSQKKTLQAMLANDLMDHELFTGILPVFEKMGELNIFGARSGTVKGKMPKIGLAQRSTNFLYFKYRFAARQMQISGRFNPYLVPGFPGLIIDKYVDAETTERRQKLIDQYGNTNVDIHRLLGTHFLANFTEITHSVDQSNGRTDVNCSYPRQVEESVEFLGSVESVQTVRKRFGTDALRSTFVAALNPPKRFSLGPSFGNITKVDDVTSTYRAEAFDSGVKLPIYQGPKRTGTGEPRIQVPVGLTLPASAYGADVVKLVGSTNQPVMFRAYEVWEEVPRYRQETVNLPAEELIRPGWYGDCWHPALIGKVYEQFFQTGAITDEQQVTGIEGASIGVPSQKAIDALAEAAMGVDIDDPRRTTAALLSLDNDSSIQAAAGFIVQTYSYVKQGGIDVEDFIRSYTWRPIASMVDMFGTSDLQFTGDGVAVLQGIEGFHSRAFGPYEDLFGLVTSDIETVLGLARASRAAKMGDTRLRKQNAVKEYVAALQFARAVLG